MGGLVMSNFEPPTPSPAPGGPMPPPPNLAQQLVSQAGFAVYEGGHSMFDEPVLVFLARPKRSWPDFDVTDHVGRGLGFAQVSVRRGMVLTRRSDVMDTSGTSVLGIKPKVGFSLSFTVSGVANASLRARSPGLVIETGGMRIGAVGGSRFLGLGGDRLTLLDDQERPVGTFRSFKRGGLFDRVDDFVVSLDRKCPDYLRDLVPALPTIIVMIRRDQAGADTAVV